MADLITYWVTTLGHEPETLVQHDSVWMCGLCDVVVATTHDMKRHAAGILHRGNTGDVTAVEDVLAKWEECGGRRTDVMDVSFDRRIQIQCVCSPETRVSTQTVDHIRQHLQTHMKKGLKINATLDYTQYWEETLGNPKDTLRRDKEKGMACTLCDADHFFKGAAATELTQHHTSTAHQVRLAIRTGTEDTLKETHRRMWETHGGKPEQLVELTLDGADGKVKGRCQCQPEHMFDVTVPYKIEMHVVSESHRKTKRSKLDAFERNLHACAMEDPVFCQEMLQIPSVREMVKQDIADRLRKRKKK